MSSDFERPVKMAITSLLPSVPPCVDFCRARLGLGQTECLITVCSIWNSCSRAQVTSYVLRTLSADAGLSKDEVKVEIEDGRVLKMSGERTKESVEEKDRWHRVERVHGRFVRRLRLPENAKLDSIEAKVENGVLEIRVPKEQEKKHEPRAVDVK